MRKRTKARECALKILYQIDITKENYRNSLKEFWANYKISRSTKDFATILVKGTAENIDSIDETIGLNAENWQVKRMAIVDRNILRLATYELLFLDDIPPKVSINEAIELAKKYADLESGKFINGILDKINKSKNSGG